MSNEERLAVLETQMTQFRQDQAEIKDKLDELLALRHKGMGAFWLAASLLGTGIVGTIIALLEYFKH